MKLFLALLFVTVSLIRTVIAEEVKLDISWSLDPKTRVYTNNQTKISFPKSIAGFEQTRATPANADGSASFAYAGKRGVITLSLAHRLLRGYPENDDCTPAFRESALAAMRSTHGSTDMEDPFSFEFAFDGRQMTGLGSTVHFESAPQLGGQAYSEFGAVLVGDFLYSYRATFPDKAGLKDLQSFLNKLGFKKRVNKPVQINAVDAPQSSRAVNAVSHSPRRV